MTCEGKQIPVRENFNADHYKGMLLLDYSISRVFLAKCHPPSLPSAMQMQFVQGFIFTTGHMESCEIRCIELYS
jgi:hypothetical protein